MAQDDVTITGTTLTDDGQHLHLKIRVHNPSNRTRHLYNSVRALRFDPPSKTLEVQMSDHGLAEPRSLRYGDELQPTNFILPSFTSVDPRSDGELSISLPRTIMRPDVAKSTSTSLKFEQLPIHEATTVKVDLAWSDTPYYEDPRIPYDHRQQLVKWARAVATHKSARKPVPTTNGSGGEEGGGNRDDRRDNRPSNADDRKRNKKRSRE
jgi:hypothetical protein